VTTSAYSVGLDVETPHRLRILGSLGGGLWPAMAGKILPYTILFMLVLGLSDTLLFRVFELPLRGHPWLLILAGLLFVLSCQLLGALLALLLRPTLTAVSISTLVTAPAFGFMGIGFPRLGMNAFAYGWGELLPGTWYLTARIDQTVRGTPVDLSWKPLFVLAAFAIGLAGLAAWRLVSMRGSARQIDRGGAPRPLAEVST
jgi:ABC-2 type transport system permease protein